MNRKSNTKLFLLEKTPPTFTTLGSQGFTGVYPPTGEQALLQFYGYHIFFQFMTKKQSSTNNVVRLVVTDVQNWWANTGIKLTSYSGISYLFLKILNEYKLRKKQRNRLGEEEKQRILLEKLSHTFWPVQPDYEKLLRENALSNKQDKRHEHDWLYLEAVRGKNRAATLGCYDTGLANREERTFLREEVLAAKREGASSTASVDILVSNSSSSSSNESRVSLYSLSPRRKAKKIEGLSKEACLVADKFSWSHRGITQMVAAINKDAENNLDNCNLSFQTTMRRRNSVRVKTSHELVQWQLQGIKKFALHWDGKIFKSLRHVDKGKDRFAVILTGTDGVEVLLGIVAIEGQSTAENVTKHIIQVLGEHQVDTEQIAALVFDTTSVNSGNKRGIVVRLQAEFDNGLLQLACRHHILELVGGAACNVVYGSTTGPKEDLFKKLIDNWDMLELNSYVVLEVPRYQRELASHVTEAVAFLCGWMKNSNKKTLRHDYLELATLAFLFLGGYKSDSMSSITFNAPGAFHHARWMSKAIYTLKIALFHQQLGDIYTPQQLEEIYSLAIFISIFYVKAWLTCTSAVEAPFNDLVLLKTLLKTEASIKGNKNSNSWPAKFFALVSEAQKKLEDHLWYLSEKLVSFALFSEHVTNIEKQRMKTALLKFQGTVETKLQEMPHSQSLSSKSLKDFIGEDSWAMFKLLGIDSSFLRSPVNKWGSSDSYRHGKNVLFNIPVVNDAPERSLGLASEMNTKTAPKSEVQLQAMIKVKNGTRKKLSDLATSTEVSTKKALMDVNYNWSN